MTTATASKEKRPPPARDTTLEDVLMHVEVYANGIDFVVGGQDFGSRDVQESMDLTLTLIAQAMRDMAKRVREGGPV